MNSHTSISGIFLWCRNIILVTGSKVQVDKRLNVQYVLIQCSYYAVCTCFVAYMVPVLQKQGFSNSEIGMLLGIRALLSVIFQPLFANFMDKYNKKISFNLLIAVMIIVSMLMTVAQLMNPGFLWMSVIFVFYGIFSFGMISFIDAMSTLYFHMGRKINYPAARGFGSLSYAVSALLVGLLVEPATILILQLVLFVPLLILILNIDTLKGIEHPTDEADQGNLSFFELMKKFPLFKIFLITIILCFIGKEMTSNFLIDVYTSLGGSSKTYGVGMFILAMSEVPAAILFIKLTNKLGIYRLMILSFSFATLRVLLILLAPNLFVLNAVQALQMLGHGLFWAGNVQFIRTILPAKYAVKAQAAVGVCYLGVGSGVGSIIGGFILENTSLTFMLLVSFILSVLGIIVLYSGKKYAKDL